MAQIKSGVVNVTNGSSTVVGGTGVDWSYAAPGNIFVVAFIADSYSVTSVHAPASTGDPWTITLDRPYSGTTAVGAGYAIHKDFTPTYNLPIIAPGDIETATILSRAMRIIDSMSAGIGGGGGNDVFSFTVGGSNNFVVGSAICFNTAAGAYDYAKLNDTDQRRRYVYGLVSSVVSSTNTVTAIGRISGVDMTGATLGAIAYLKDPAASTTINWVYSTTGLTTIIPLFQVEDVATGTVHIIPTAALASPSVMTGATSLAVGAAGSVPTPPVGSQNKALTGDGTFKDMLPTDGSLLYRHLNPRSTPLPAEYNFAVWQDANLPTSRVSDMLFDLYYRSIRADFRQLSSPTQAVFSGNSAGIGINSPGVAWTVPAGVYLVMVEMWGAGNAGIPSGAAGKPRAYGTWGGFSAISPTEFNGYTKPGKAGAYMRFFMPVTPGDTYTMRPGFGQNREYAEITFNYDYDHVPDTFQTYIPGVAYNTAQAYYLALAAQLGTYIKPPSGITLDNDYLAYAGGGVFDPIGSGIHPACIDPSVSGVLTPTAAMWCPGDRGPDHRGVHAGNGEPPGVIVNNIMRYGINSTAGDIGQCPIWSAICYLDRLSYLAHRLYRPFTATNDGRPINQGIDGTGAYLGGRGGKSIYGYDLNTEEGIAVPYSTGITPGGGAAVPSFTSSSDNGIAVPKGGHGRIRLTY